MDNSQALIPGMGTAPGYRTMQLPPTTPTDSYALSTAAKQGDAPTEANVLHMEGHDKLASLLMSLANAGAKSVKANKIKKAKGK